MNCWRGGTDAIATTGCDYRVNHRGGGDRAGLASVGVSSAIAQSRSNSADAAAKAIGTDVRVDIDLEALYVDAKAADVRLVREHAGSTYLVSTSGNGDMRLILDHADGSSASACTPLEYSRWPV